MTKIITQAFVNILVGAKDERGGGSCRKIPEKKNKVVKKEIEAGNEEMQTSFNEPTGDMNSNFLVFLLLLMRI